MVHSVGTVESPNLLLQETGHLRIHLHNITVLLVNVILFMIYFIRPIMFRLATLYKGIENSTENKNIIIKDNKLWLGALSNNCVWIFSLFFFMFLLASILVLLIFSIIIATQRANMLRRKKL